MLFLLCMDKSSSLDEFNDISEIGLNGVASDPNKI